jgi:hypothetical protein
MSDQNLTRRAIMAGASAVPLASACVAFPSIAAPVGAEPESDPIYAAIERHRLAFATCVSDEDSDRYSDAEQELLETAPTTFRGMLALLTYLDEETDIGWGSETELVVETLLRACRAIESGRQPLPASSVEAATSPDAELTAGAAAVPSQAQACASSNHRAALARFEQMLGALRTRHVAPGWSVDEAAAERALRYFRRAARGAPGDKGDEQAVLDFIFDHGGSLDWIFRGDAESLIAMLAYASPRAKQMSSPPQWAGWPKDR